MKQRLLTPPSMALSRHNLQDRSKSHTSQRALGVFEMSFEGNQMWPASLYESRRSRLGPTVSFRVRARLLQWRLCILERGSLAPPIEFQLKAPNETLIVVSDPMPECPQEQRRQLLLPFSEDSGPSQHDSDQARLNCLEPFTRNTQASATSRIKDGLSKLGAAR